MSSSGRHQFPVSSAAFRPPSQELSQEDFAAALECLASDPSDLDVYNLFVFHFRAAPFKSTHTDLALLTILLDLLSDPQLFTPIGRCLQVIIRHPRSRLSDVSTVIFLRLVALLCSSDVANQSFALELLHPMSMRVCNLPSILFTHLGIEAFADLVRNSAEFAVQLYGMELFRLFVASAQFATDTLPVIFGLCHAVFQAPAHAGMICGIRILYCLSVKGKEFSAAVVDGEFVDYLNHFLSLPKPFYLEAIKLLTWLIRDGLASDAIEVLGPLTRMTDDDEDIAMSSCQLISAFVLQNPVSVNVLSEFKIGSRLIQLLLYGTVHAKRQALCILKSVLDNGDDATRAQALVPELVLPILELTEATHQVMWHLEVWVMNGMVEVDTVAGGQFGIGAAFLTEEAQEVIANIMEREPSPKLATFLSKFVTQ
jgi:hypothetical protein